MAACRIEIGEAFVNDARGLDARLRRRLGTYLKWIERNRNAETPQIVELPFPWRPGTLEASFGDLNIRFCVDVDPDTGDEILRFIRVRVPTGAS